MDWEAAARRHDPATVEGRLWAGLQRLIAARRATRAIHVQGVVEPIWTGNDHVFGLCRAQAGERLLVLANFTADPQPVALSVLRDHGFALTERGRRARRPRRSRPTTTSSCSRPTSTSGSQAIPRVRRHPDRR